MGHFIRQRNQSAQYVDLVKYIIRCNSRQRNNLNLASSLEPVIKNLRQVRDKHFNSLEQAGSRPWKLVRLSIFLLPLVFKVLQLLQELQTEVTFCLRQHSYEVTNIAAYVVISRRKSKGDPSTWDPHHLKNLRRLYAIVVDM